MKKLLCVFLCLAMFTLAACTPTPDDVSSEPAALSKMEVSASKGEIEGLKFSLGADVKEVKDYFKKLAEDYEDEHGDDKHDHTNLMGNEEYAYYELVDMPDYMLIETAEARYYYDGMNSSKGILAIATDNEAFGFIPGLTSKYEVESEFSSACETVTADEDDFELLSMPQDGTLILRYTVEQYQLDFYFLDNMLLSIAIVDTENWVY